jgi:hypothetical protein
MEAISITRERQNANWRKGIKLARGHFLDKDK